MATWEDVRRIALGLPETFELTSRGSTHWRVAHRESGKNFVWERPLGKHDLEQLGDAAPERPILGARVPDLVLRDGGERDVLFQQRRDARPLRVAPADDQLVVSQPEQQLVHVPPSGAP